MGAGRSEGLLLVNRLVVDEGWRVSVSFRRLKQPHQATVIFGKASDVSGDSEQGSVRYD